MFLNLKNVFEVMNVNEFNSILTNDIRYEERDETFTYANVLQNEQFIFSLSNWLSTITKQDFLNSTLCEGKIHTNSEGKIHTNEDTEIIQQYIPFKE